MHLQKLAYRHFGINGGGLQLRMAEKLLDKADVGAALEHVGRAGVAQKAAGTAFGEVRARHLGPTDHAREDTGVKRPAVAGLKQGRFARIEHQERARLSVVALRPAGRAGTERNDAILAALALANGHRAVPELKKRSGRVMLYFRCLDPNLRLLAKLI